MLSQPCNGLVRWTMATCLAIGVFGAGAPARADESLDRLLAQALTDNPAIAAARQRWEVAKAQEPQARALDDPVVSLTEWSIPSNFNLGETSETWYGVEQSFPFPGTRRLRAEVARLDAAAVEQEYHAAVRTVRAQLKTAYAKLYRVQREIRIHLEHQRLLGELIDIALARYALGQAPQQASLKAQVELSMLHASLLVVEQEQQSLRLQLNALAGRPDDPLFYGEVRIEYRPVDQSPEALEARALDQRPEYQAARRMIDRQREAVALAKREQLPNFMAEVSYWDVHDGPNRWMLTGKMTLPWLAAGKYRAKVAAEAAGLRRNQAELEARRNDTLFAVRDLLIRLKTSEALIEVYQKGIIAQAEQALESARIAYTAGRIDFFNLIDAEQRLRDVRLAADVALADWAERRAELERVVGADL